MRVTFFLLLIGVVTSTNVGYAAAADSDDVSNKRIALSFDDAPKGAGPRFSGDERAAVLMAALESAEAGPAVFFVKTSNLQRPGGSDRVARYAAAGHLIANHTHSHPWLKRTDTDQYIEDIDRAEDLLRGFENRRAWFRFPFLDEGTPRAKRDAVRAALQARGLMNGYVTVDNYDWYLDAKWKAAVDEGRSVDIEALRGVYVDMLMGAVVFFHDLAIDSLNQSPAQVILLHENDVAAMFIGDLITALRADGWSIVSPDEAYADPIAKVVPETLMTRQGHIAALAVDAGLDPRILTHLAIEETQIDALLVERGVFGEMKE
jgi:peptidoglycan/xylan/chitin deacetylase (PgdA/CDA1 family)